MFTFSNRINGVMMAIVSVDVKDDFKNIFAVSVFSEYGKSMDAAIHVSRIWNGKCRMNRNICCGSIRVFWFKFIFVARKECLVHGLSPGDFLLLYIPGCTHLRQTLNQNIYVFSKAHHGIQYNRVYGVVEELVRTWLWIDFKRFQVCSKCAYHIFVLYFIL